MLYIYISLGIKSPMVFRQLFGAGSSRVRICGEKYARVRLLNFQKNIGFVCVRPNLPSQIGGSKMVQTMCNQGPRFSNFLSFGSYALRFFYNLYFFKSHVSDMKFGLIPIFAPNFLRFGSYGLRIYRI